MTWYRFAQQESYKDIEKKIKAVLKTHPLPQKLMHDYHIPAEDLDNHLQIEVDDLDGRYAEGNGERIRLDRKIIGKDNFVEEHFHYVMHEFFHWVKRRNEELFYFNDEEEVQSFTLNIAWEIIRGQSDIQISRLIYPIIKGHFKNELEAKKMYIKMLQEAHDIVNLLGK